MEKFNAICGLPRAGSTLLCNILNQNPRFHASSSSCLAQAVRVLSKLWSSALEIKSDLIVDEAGTKDRMTRSAVAMVSAWYRDEGPVVFDKCRPWNHNSLVLNQLFPDAHMFVCVRDLRSVFASNEKNHKTYPMLDTANTTEQLLLKDRAEKAFASSGLIGNQILGVEDLLRHNHPFVHFIKFEELANTPDLVMDSIYKALGETPYAHNFKDVVNTATDVDQVWLGKFPHTGSGKVTPPIDDTAEHVPPDILGGIMDRFSLYNRAFGYR